MEYRRIGQVSTKTYLRTLSKINQQQKAMNRDGEPRHGSCVPPVYEVPQVQPLRNALKRIEASARQVLKG